MPAPKGNQYACVNKGRKDNGRFLKKDQEDRFLEKLGEEMLDWVRKNKPFHLKFWCVENNINYKYIIHWTDREVFRSYYDLSMQIISTNFLQKALLKEIDSGIANRFLGVYFSDLREYDFSLKRCGMEQVNTLIIPTRNPKVHLPQNMPSNLIVGEVEEVKKIGSDSVKK